MSKLRLSQILPIATCLLVLAAYAVITGFSVAEWGRQPADYSNNLLVRAFRSGHLYLPKAVPPGLLRLPDPYDPEANLVYRMSPYGLHDLSLYHGKLYLYFGVTPALVLFWPWLLVTGHYLMHKWAVALFCGTAFLIMAALLRAVRRNYFPELGTGVLCAGILAVGLATAVPVMLQRADVCEVPIGCASCLVMAALAAVWAALHHPAQRLSWLAAGSLAYGLAVGARPSVLFGGAILLIPIWAEWDESRRLGAQPSGGIPLWKLLAAAAVPLALCGAGLALYNYARFGNFLEFGQHYQLAADRQDNARHFSLGYLWFNFRVYFLAPVRWSAAFPFARQIVSPTPPPGHATIEDPFGILTNIPVALFALAAPLCWRGRPAETVRNLRRFVLAVAILFFTSAGIMCLFYGNCSRYEVEFLPALILLAALGIFGLERALAGRPGRRAAARVVWIAALVFSAGFNLLCSAEHYAVERYNLGNFLVQIGRAQDAVVEFRRAIAVRSDFSEAYDNLGSIFLQAGRTAEAVEDFQKALKFKPDSVDAHNNLGNALLDLGRPADAIAEYEAALRLKPDSAFMHYNLGNVYVQSGRLADAAAQYEAAVRLRPAFAVAHYNLSAVLLRLGQRDQALAEYGEAVRLDPSLGRPSR